MTAGSAPVLATPAIRILEPALHTLQEIPRQPLPVGPPIGGPVWTLVVPAVLLAVAGVGTWLLYRHFTGRPDGESAPSPEPERRETSS